jgi:hypothetical protein
MVPVGPIGEIGRLIDGIAGLQRLVIANRRRSVDRRDYLVPANRGLDWPALVRLAGSC